ncbi:UbiD family decarboxylase [Nocardia gipuzkoensis]|uniref:UbiD family decarboxylase n=1 Tax=Nocardia gipuzkoensis TaxID=2749991 RepID=UPI00237DA3BA|nr:UbiD family decarboxylase [Nocardia gipuzkoensis]MDE1674871.1 UbiD family decarboxylase [Nocardia gipuzkoensis]
MERSLGDWLVSHGGAIGLRTVNNPVNPARFEATALLAQLEDCGSPPVRFSDSTDLCGRETGIGLVFNAYGSRKSIASVVGIESADWSGLLDAFATKATRLKETVTVGDAPIHANVRIGAEADLTTLPWIRHVDGEGGLYFTPILVSRALGQKRSNLSWNRAMYLDERHMGVHISPRQLWAFQRDAEKSGEDLPVAAVLGHHPAFNLAAAALTPVTVDEYHVAGALIGEGVRVVDAVSFGDALPVPAEAEIVIEGRLLARRRAVEGPFGEYMRYLGPQKLSHVFEVDAICWRDDPHVLGVFAGHRDHLNAHIGIHASYLAAARAAVPQVRDVAWFDGGGPTTVVVSMAKSAEGQPMRAAMAIMAVSNVIKQVIVADPDIDIRDARQVMFAVSTRVRASEDLVVVPGLQANLLDPSQTGFERASGIVIDATWPLGGIAPEIVHVPEEALAEFPLARFNIS